MGLDYSHYLIPGPGSLDRRFDAGDLARALEVLRAGGWTVGDARASSSVDGKLENARLAWDALETSVRALQPSGRPVIVTIEGVANRTPPDDADTWTEDPRLDAARCHEVRVFSFDALTVIPVGSLGDGPPSVPCPRCGAEATRKLDFATERPALLIHSMMHRQERILPGSCVACGARLDPATVKARARSPMTGRTIEVVAPFARFGLVLTPPSRGCPRTLGKADPALRAALHEATGVAFRELGSIV